MTMNRVRALNIASYRKAGTSFTYYPKKSDLHDNFSRDLLDMKSGLRPELESLFVLRLLEFIVLNNLNLTGIVRILGHDEMYAEANHPLHRVAMQLANKTGIPFHYDWFTKPLTPKTASLGSRAERFAHIHGTYSVALPHHSTEPMRILVIDDVVTSRTTAQEVHRALREANPNVECYFFALAESYHRNTMARPQNIVRTPDRYHYPHAA
ncbi:hypothetical protein DC083_04830 [Ignatzschineria ureiclastica]|uniref:Phosphoribosyltransferase domain-containing protein n=1 Tax=Ignatzschineria ureiclastica TaxID=472582 RepID=A0A2U2AF16_9GAMM|nr:hypothetical protein [Ignatzschineria ureiclastica]PWD81217.1 hypothetical protein DC083_04830 [Ignatzschineria ureiclastica]GGZ97205.1 hypothetical protein GCM10007162_11700 [Ignatzschineria ureiclastica]